jgi:hypothetical protein
MTLSEFAGKYDLRLKRGECGDQFIPCRRVQIFDYGDGCFGVLKLSDSPRGCGHERRSMEAVRFQFIQDGEPEDRAQFNPSDPQQVKRPSRWHNPTGAKNV